MPSAEVPARAPATRFEASRAPVIRRQPTRGSVAPYLAPSSCRTPVLADAVGAEVVSRKRETLKRERVEARRERRNVQSSSEQTEQRGGGNPSCRNRKRRDAWGRSVKPAGYVTLLQQLPSLCVGQVLDPDALRVQYAPTEEARTVGQLDSPLEAQRVKMSRSHANANSDVNKRQARSHCQLRDCGAGTVSIGSGEDGVDTQQGRLNLRMPDITDDPSYRRAQPEPR
jgi:hypothetical protein